MSSSIIISLFDSIPLWLMITPIIACSVIAVAIVVERLIFYNKIDHDYRLIITGVRNSFQKNNFDAVRSFCKDYDGPVIRIIEELTDGYKSPDTHERLLLESSTAAIRRIERFVGVISTIATVSPMLGLFGTVTGMMKSFNALSRVGPVAHDLLAHGISEALITTALGLLVAIPSLIFYNYMVSRVDYYIKEVEYVANSLLEIGEE